ncbi:MAG: hypothetical protein HRT42_06875 [Campylobacteraceae bacterium]|nr:hypothetical protein [Campylobacteraceae bacterium]
MALCETENRVIYLNRFDLKLKHPANYLVTGPSQTGKTTFIFNIIENLEHVITPVIKNVVYIYGMYQKMFKKYEKKVFFTDDLKYISASFDTPTLLILDDVMLSLGNSTELLELFTVRGHHRSISVILVLHNIFSIGKVFKSLKDNTHYYYITEYLQDMIKLKIFARQIGDSQDPNYFMSSYLDAIREKYNGLLVDVHPKSELRKIAKYRSKVHQINGQVLYIPKRLRNIFSCQDE